MNHQEKFEQILRECFQKARERDVPEDEFKQLVSEGAFSTFFFAMQEAARQAFEEGFRAYERKFIGGALTMPENPQLSQDSQAFIERLKIFAKNMQENPIPISENPYTTEP